MSNSRQMSAKDKAFERERIKLHSQIQKKNAEICDLNVELQHYKDQIKELQATIDLLETQIGIPKEELLEHIERNKRLDSFIKPLMTFGHGFY